VSKKGFHVCFDQNVAQAINKNLLSIKKLLILDKLWIHYCSKVWGRYVFFFLLKKVSYAHQDCIYLIKNIVKTVILSTILSKPLQMLPTTKLTEKDKEGAAIVFRDRRGLL